MGLLAASKLDASIWMSFAECMADVVTLRETARRLGVSLYTAWFMRMRVCEIMSYRLSDARPGSFQIDDTHFVKNLLGNHKRSQWYEMPRKPHRNGQDGRKKGGSRSKNRVGVCCGINEYGDCFCELISEGVANGGEARLVVYEKIPEGSSVTLDGERSYLSAVKHRPHTVIDPKDLSSGNINMINALHSRLKEFLAPFHGVATRRMQRYLDWFCWREQFRRSDADKRCLLFSHEAEGRYPFTRALTHIESHSFMNYTTRLRNLHMIRHLHIVV